MCVILQPFFIFFHTDASRSSDHYVNNSGSTTSVWFDRRRRIPHPLGGLEGANWSANVREILKCPATPQSYFVMLEIDFDAYVYYDI